MTSLEHESNDTSASASDYGNNDWDNENWGEMDVSLLKKNTFYEYKLYLIVRHHRILVHQWLVHPIMAH